MSTAIHPVSIRRQAVVSHQGWTTPEILKGGVLAIWVSCAMLMAAAIMGARSHRHAMQVVGRDSAPSIIAAQEIRTAMASMDAESTSADTKIYGEQRGKAAAAIVAAAKNITYGEAEEGPIRTMTQGLSAYSERVQAARDQRGMLPWRNAWANMDGVLLPAAEELDKANRKAIDDAYGEQSRKSSVAMTMLILAALVAGVALTGMQIFLAGRMRRAINPLLFLATLAAWILTIYAGQRFRDSDHELKVAKEDAFESIHVLLQARALAFAASGDLARAGFDKERHTQYEADFLATATRIRKLLDDERKNVTFAGEEEAAKQTSDSFNQYLAEPSGAAFSTFDLALKNTLDVNRKAFGNAVDRGFADVNQFEVVAPVWALAIAVLAWLGLRPRLREYSA
jgi:hypothetical protein